MTKAIVCDIEGPTTSVSFVKDVLFPYSRQRMDSFITQHYAEPEIAALLEDTKHEMGEPDASLPQVIQQLIRWIDEDRKITCLKAIQGHIWKSGYQNGDYYGHVYKDAYTQLIKWHKAGIALYIFSSGSVYAQKLLFGHTEYGDLNNMFSGNFDTTIGAKSDVASYRTIASKINLPSAEILFASDIEKELDAAKAAGMKTVWLVRDSSISSHSSHPQVNSFSDIVLD